MQQNNSIKLFYIVFILIKLYLYFFIYVRMFFNRIKCHRMILQVFLRSNGLMQKIEIILTNIIFLFCIFSHRVA